MHELRSRVCFMTPANCPDQTHVVRLVRLAVEGGAGTVLYRVGADNTCSMIQKATAMLQYTRVANVPLIIEGRVDVALAVGADGVHLASGDMPVAMARRLLGPRAIIGVTVASNADARLAQRDDATYLAGELDGAAHREEIENIRHLTPLPYCVLGDNGPRDLPALADNPPDLVTVVSVVAEAPSPISAMRELNDLIRRSWPSRKPPP